MRCLRISLYLWRFPLQSVRSYRRLYGKRTILCVYPAGNEEEGKCAAELTIFPVIFRALFSNVLLVQKRSCSHKGNFSYFPHRKIPSIVDRLMDFLFSVYYKGIISNTLALLFSFFFNPKLSPHSPSPKRKSLHCPYRQLGQE
jgi:hypothetical protein